MVDSTPFNAGTCTDQQIRMYIQQTQLCSDVSDNQPPVKQIKLEHHVDTSALVPLQPILQSIAHTSAQPPHLTFATIQTLIVLFLQYNVAQYTHADDAQHEPVDTRIPQLIDTIQQYTVPPFTLQRICELLCDARKQYSTLEKYISALCKCIIGVSGDALSAELLQVTSSDSESDSDQTEYHGEGRQQNGEHTTAGELLHNVSNGHTIHQDNDEEDTT